jgi:hypothetical protein
MYRHRRGAGERGPLKPGDDREFRLTSETAPENWNQQMPV